jgi:hypothetical protein
LKKIFSDHNNQNYINLNCEKRKQIDKTIPVTFVENIPKNKNESVKKSAVSKREIFCT